jgi:glutamyl-Q tRNA(Asp) synthetase
VTFTRFAPSPTGLLHLGHAFAARVARELARSLGGTDLLRFEDIDHTRVRDEFYAAIIEDLDWLGLGGYPAPERQLAHTGGYRDALDALRRRGLVYPCFCSRREIEAEVAGMVRAPHGPEGPIYPGTCRRLDEAARRERLAAGREPAWRLDAAAAAAETGPLEFSDLRLGDFAVEPGLLGDVVLGRRDIGTSYHLAVVVDDGRQGITHVTRGEDLLGATHVQRLLQALLGLPRPAYLHHPLVTGADGRRLAKRDRARSIRQFRESGHSPGEVLAMLPPIPEIR